MVSLTELIDEGVLTDISSFSIFGFGCNRPAIRRQDVVIRAGAFIIIAQQKISLFYKLYLGGRMPDISQTWVAAYDQREDLKSFGSAGLALFALALEFGYDDLETIAADAVVDGSDDRGCDLVFLNKENRPLIIAQSYEASKPKIAAKANKAATLRQAVSWLVEADITEVPERLRASAEAVRASFQVAEIEVVHLWFVHNCPGSKNVKAELKVIENTANAIITTKFRECRKLRITAQEISSDVLERLYSETNTPILVNERITFSVPSGFRFDEGEWESFVAPIQLVRLKELFSKHDTKLFSANVRDFLGMMAKESNINYQMKKSLAEYPSNFFIYNNGLTILTHGISIEDSEAGKLVSVNGFSVVNGAQTTGTIGTSADEPPATAYVLARFICTKNETLVGDVVRFNNSQNAVTASDFRSTDPIQRRLVNEMKEISDAEYDGGRRGGISAAIKRRPKLLPSYSVGQAIAAIHGDPIVAYNEKSAIWSRDALYSKYFNDDLSAAHVVFCYSLLRAVEKEKILLRQKEAGGDLSATDRSKLEFYRRRGSVFLLTAAVGECLETIADQVIPNRFRISFSKEVSPESATCLWRPVVETLSNLTSQLDEALNDGLKNSAKVKETLKTYSQMVASLKNVYSPIFEPFRAGIIARD